MVRTGRHAASRLRLALLVAALACRRGAEVTNPLPGAPPFDTGLVAKLAAAEHAGERPHTRHLRPDGSPLYTNRLALESSPYLRQHAHNPVDWYPWGDEAFEAAKRLERPVLLSVGYSTCHWCHVMEEESFEDEEIARYLNENYVAIKVDREERPDVDSLYMTAVQAMSGSGGWPMTAWLTPERQPFYGGTYFPPRDGERGVRTGFLTLLKTLKDAFDRQPMRVADAAADVAERVRLSVGPGSPSGLPSAAVLHAAARDAAAHFDATNGGTDRVPKFPSGLPLRFLLRYHRRTGDEQALRMATVTLEKMAAGGVHDQVGGGFHRYATDARWLVPHFEKMLYDNALLALAYLDAYQATGREDFAGIVRDILGYVARDMTAPGGAFYAATDADSPGADGRAEEGWFFTWTPAEVEAAVGADRAPLAIAFYGVTPDGNFHGRSILSTPKPLAEAAQEVHLPPAEAQRAVEETRRLLLAARSRRAPPPRDEKIVSGWNGLMISAYARAGLTLGDEEYTTRAAHAAEFLLAHRDREGRLPRAVKDGRAGPPGYLEDYAFLAAGLLDLYEATGASRWLETAIALDGVLARRFEDREAGGFFRTAEDGEALLAREKPSSDGAEPSGNSVAVMNLLRLSELTGDERYRQRAERALAAFGDVLGRAPTGLAEMLLALDFALDTPKEIVIVTAGGRAAAEPLLRAVRGTFVPNRVLVVPSDAGRIADLVPLVEGKVAQGGRPTAYVCERRRCELPTTDPTVLAEQLRKVRPLDSSRPDLG